MKIVQIFEPIARLSLGEITDVIFVTFHLRRFAVVKGLMG